MSLPSDILKISQSDIERLINDQAQEGPYLEYKRELPVAWNDAAKHELLADVTAFANSGGGDLLFGVEEDGDARATRISPLTGIKADTEVRRLQDLILNLSDPRMPGVQVHAIKVEAEGSSGTVIVIRVPQSWHGPHRVRTNQHFFIRDGLRKRQLDVPEIRSLFLRTEDQATQARNFRTDRLGKILVGESPQRLVDAPILVVHLLPVRAIQGLAQVNPVIYSDSRRLPAIGISPGYARLNIDGAIMARNLNDQGETHGYSQIFRNGFLESTYALTRNMGEYALLASTDCEEYLIKLLHDFREELDHFEINADCAVLLSLTRANEVRLGVRAERWFMEDHNSTFDRQILTLPDVLARSDQSPEQAMKPAFDLLWQAAGFKGSDNYDSTGNRILHR